MTFPSGRHAALAFPARPPKIAPMTETLRPYAAWGWRHWPAVAAGVAAALLAGAHTFEAFGFEPCALCLRQREVLWGVLAIAAAGAWFWAREPESRNARAVDALLAAAFLTSTFVAGYHAGVEWGFWPGPASCTAGAVGDLSGGDILGALNEGGRVVMCDEAAWRDPVLRLSMAGWNAIISFGLAIASFFAARRPGVFLEPEPQGASVG